MIVTIVPGIALAGLKELIVGYTSAFAEKIVATDKNNVRNSFVKSFIEVRFICTQRVNASMKQGFTEGLAKDSE